jgi:hypothetical protein
MEVENYIIKLQANRSAWQKTAASQKFVNLVSTFMDKVKTKSADNPDILKILKELKVTYAQVKKYLDRTIVIKWISGDDQDLYLLAQKPEVAANNGTDLTLSMTASNIYDAMSHFKIADGPAFADDQGVVATSNSNDPLAFTLKLKLA